MSPADLLLDRLTFTPAVPELAPIPWPAGLAPAAALSLRTARGAIPKCDVLVITWTAAEAMALADVLTPGASSKTWLAYGRNWDQYEPQLTGRSPARVSRRLGSFHMSQIGGAQVCCFKSELHPATDADTLPAAQLAAQLAGESDARLVITTGTAGGAGDGTLLGDVCVATAIHADFTTRLAHHPWSQEESQAAPLSDSQQATLTQAEQLFDANSGHLPPSDRQPRIWSGHVVSTDFFAFASRDDHYGLAAYDSEIRAVEMDDAAVARGVLGLTGPPMLASVRNASDPVMPDGSEASARQAAQIYRRYGYFTTVNSAIACWALAAGLPAHS